MITHKAYLSKIGRTQKTAKTECGMTVRTALIAVDCDATCSECRAVIDRSRSSMAEVAAMVAPYENEAIAKSRADLVAFLKASETTKYRTVYFL